MSVKAILLRMLELLQAEVKAVVAGDHVAVRTGADEYERLQLELEHVEYDIGPEEVKQLVEKIQAEKAKLESLLSVETNRVGFLLRLILGGTTPAPVGYPKSVKAPANATVLNRRA
ncbi:MAG: hypothetical protein ACM3XM_07225 [Mycobacterium leprae]